MIHFLFCLAMFSANPPPKRLKHQSFPLSANFFPPVKLGKPELGKCEDFASKLLSSYLKSEYEERMGTSKHRWEALGEKDGVSSYMRNGSVRCSWHFKFEATVQGTVRDIIDGLYCDNTEEFRDMCEHVHEDKVVDCTVLGVLKDREEDTEEHDGFKFLGFKWKGFAPLSPQVEGRDYCLLEYSGITTDVAGGELGFRIFESVKIPECPSQYNSLGFVRGKMSRCCFYRDRSERGMVQVLVIGYYDPCATCSEWKNNRNDLIQKSMVNLAACVVNIPTCIEAKTISSRLFLPRSEWVENKHRKSCFLCQKNFHIMRHRHHCRVCGEIMCRNCSIQKTLRQYKNGITKVDYIRICKSCKGNAKTAPLKKGSSTSGSIRGGDSDLRSQSFSSEDEKKTYRSSFSQSEDGFKNGLFTPGYNSSIEGRLYGPSSSVCSEDDPDQDIAKLTKERLQYFGSSSLQLQNNNVAFAPHIPSVCSDPEEGLRTKTEPPPSFQKINRTLAEQEMLLGAMKSTAASYNSQNSARTSNVKQLSDDSTRFEVLK